MKTHVFSYQTQTLGFRDPVTLLVALQLQPQENDPRDERGYAGEEQADIDIGLRIFAGTGHGN